jgi:AcrR family transcriptional regulator
MTQPVRRRMAPDARREEILRAAGELFARPGYSAVSVADIARSAGSSASLIIFYFGSKQALYLEVLTTAAEELRTGLLGPPGPPSLPRLRRILHWYAEHARTHRDGFLSLARGEHEVILPEASAIFEQLRAELIARTVADLVELGYTEVADDPVAELAIRGYLGYVDATVLHWLSLPDEQLATMDADTIADLGVGTFSGVLQTLAARTRG